MKKLIVLSILLSGSTAMSLSAQPLKRDKDLSLGLQGGYGYGHSKVKRAETYNFPGYQNKRDSSNLSSEGFISGAMIEYQQMLQSEFFYRVNLTYLYSNTKGKISTTINAGDPITTLVKIKHSYGASLHLGKAFNNVFPFLILGISTSKIESKTDELPRTGFGSASKYRQGIEFGFGTDFYITPNISIGAQLSHIEYNKLSYSLKNNLGQKVANNKIKPKNNKALLRFKYKFNSFIF